MCVCCGEPCACVVSKLQGQRSQRKAASNKDMNTRMLSCFTAPFLHKGKPVRHVHIGTQPAVCSKGKHDCIVHWPKKASEQAADVLQLEILRNRRRVQFSTSTRGTRLWHWQKGPGDPCPPSHCGRLRMNASNLKPQFLWNFEGIVCGAHKMVW